MNRMHTIRAEELLQYTNREIPIYVIGAGSVGSYTVKSLAAMGFSNITIFDDDNVSEENIGNQDFMVSQIGLNKANQLANNMHMFYKASIQAINQRFSKNTVGLASKCIVIMAVDSMSARKLIFETLIETKVKARIIDCRMSIQCLNLFCLDITDKESRDNYKKTLYSDNEAVQESCTNKAVAFTSLLAGGLVSKIAVQFADKKCDSSWKSLIYDIENFDMIYHSN